MENCIQNERVRRGLSRSEVAQRVGVTRDTVYKWEKGQIAIPFAKLKRIAQLFQLAPVALIPQLTEVPHEDTVREEGHRCPTCGAPREALYAY